MKENKDIAMSANISLYNRHIDKIKNYQKKHSNILKTESAALQYILDNFDKKNKKTVFKDLMVFMGYPLLIVGLMLYVSVTTQNANEILIAEGFYFNELYVANQIFFVIGFTFLGLTIPLSYVFVHKLRKRD